MITALVPAKSLSLAKGRLAEVLTEPERRELALAMLEDVVRALHAAPSVDSVIVVTLDDDILRRAPALGAASILQPPESSGLNAGLTHALGVLEPQPGTVLVVLADVPEILPADVERVLQALPVGRGAVLCPSADGGTNALALRPPDAMSFCFGEQSAAKHRTEAARVGIPIRELHLDSLSRDVDSPDDLRALSLRPGQTATHRVLARLGIAERASV